MTKALRWMMVAMFLLGAARVAPPHVRGNSERGAGKLAKLRAEESARPLMALFLAVRELALCRFAPIQEALEVEGRWRSLEKDPRFPRVLAEEGGRIASLMIFLGSIREVAARGLAERYKPDAEKTLEDLWEAHKKERRAPWPPPREPDPFSVAAYVRTYFPIEGVERWPWVWELFWEFEEVARLRRNLAARAFRFFLEELERKLSKFPPSSKGQEKEEELRAEESARLLMALFLAIRELALFGFEALEVEGRWRRLEKDPRFPRVLAEEGEKIVSSLMLFEGIREVTGELAERYKPDAERTLEDLWEAHKKGETLLAPPREPDPFLVAAYVRTYFPREVWMERWPWIEEFSWEFGSEIQMRRSFAAIVSRFLLEELERKLSKFHHPQKGRV